MAVRREILKNNSETQLNGAINNSTTSVVVDDGSVFPSTGDFRILIESEVMLVTARSTNTLTVVRGAEGTAAASHADDLKVVHVLTEDGLETYIRQNVSRHQASRTPFKLVDASGTTLNAASFTKVDGTTATTPADQSGAIGIVKTSSSANPDYTLMLRTAPATPYTVIACITMFSPLTGSGSVPSFGLLFRESSTGKFTVNQIRATINGEDVHVRRMTNATTHSANAVGPNDSYIPGDEIWFKVTDNGTNLISYISNDGINWVQVATEVRTVFMAGGPDQVGWCINNENNVSFSIAGQLLAWDEGA